MTSAARLYVAPKDVRANWLGRYMGVERQFDQELFDALTEATKAIDKELLKLKGVDAKGAAVRRLQLSLAHREIRKQINLTYGDIGTLVRGYRNKAAEAAVEATLKHESRTLARLLPSKVARTAYGESLRVSARRNIESVVARVLQTQQPLSQRLYKSKALANGLVSRAINNGLARGDSAADISRAVHNLVSPKVPGGVTYVAKRLGRTEINNAFHAQAIYDAQQNPVVTHMRWNLSKEHASTPNDPCEMYAFIEIFDKNSVPEKPHPNCRCFVTPETDDYDVFESQLLQGHFDEYLDDILG